MENICTRQSVQTGGGGGGGGAHVVFVRFCPFSENRVPNGQKRTKIVTFHLNCLHNL